MLIWSGWGLAALLPIAVIVAVVQLCQHGFGLDPEVSIMVGLVVGGGVGAAFVRWFDTWRERRRPPRRLVDQRSGQTVTVTRRDSLFWIPIRFLPIPYLALFAAGVIGGVTEALGA